jgi:carboxyl-terminal processing protease
MNKLVKYMFNRKTLPIVLVLVGVGLFYAFRSLGIGHPEPTNKYEKIIRNVGDMLQKIHYSPRKMDDAFSKEVFKKYLEDLDPDKYIFLQSDIKGLQKFETKIDDEILGSPIRFFPAASNLFTTRVTEASAFYKEILSKPFNFTVNESVILNAEKSVFPKNEAERKEVWRKRLKLLTLERYYELLEEREKNKGKEKFVVKTDAELEQIARDKVTRIMNKRFDFYRNKFKEEDRFNLLINTITSTFDPHTNFFPPIEKQSFDESMSGRFYGIGAQLRDDDGNIKVVALTTGGPAWKAGDLQVDDIIIKVAQGKDEPTDLAGYSVDDAVKLIRGKVGTDVRITVKRADGTIKEFTYKREEIVLEDTFARSAIVNSDKGKIGYIFLPEFYTDLDRPNGNHCSEDVAREVVKLKEQNVTGIVIDLRNNGGGSLYEVVQMVGLFIPEGPVVQVKGRTGSPKVLPDDNKTVLYDGPLAVMVNELSASASEIFAAAIQDYKRGIIIGSTSTYGKGTVQRNIGLDENAAFSLSNSDLGTVKLTLQKFYRINGGSTQLKGVTPDIVIPDRWEFLKFREKDNPDALKWDEVGKANYNLWKNNYDADAVIAASMERLKQNQNLALLRTTVEWLSKRTDREFSLQLEKYRADQKQVGESSRKVESFTKLTKELPIELLAADLTKIGDDKDKLKRSKDWLNNLKLDIYLDETIKVVTDMISMPGVAKK